MILHTVAFRLKHESGSDAEADFLKAGGALAELAMVHNFKTYKQTSEKNDFDFGFSMEFATVADYQAYSEHPMHVDFVTNRWIPEVADFLELDYEELP
jgi:hypothetical protein